MILERLDDEYDRLFGEPTTEVFSITDALDFIDDVIRFCDTENISEDTNQADNSKYKLLVKRVVMTNLFERAVKTLCKKHRKDVLKELKDAIIRLGKYEITREKDNHRLNNAEGHLDLHLDGSNLILLYKYETEEVLTLTFGSQTVLRLQDIVNHDELKRYDRRKYKYPTKNADIDTLFNTLGNDAE